MSKETSEQLTQREQEAVNGILQLMKVFPVSDVTKKDLQANAESIAYKAKNPVKTYVGVKIVKDFLTKVEATIKPNVLEVIKKSSNEETIIGNVKIKISKRKNFDWDSDKVIAGIKVTEKERKENIKKMYEEDPEGFDLIKINETEFPQLTY